MEGGVPPCSFVPSDEVDVVAQSHQITIHTGTINHLTNYRRLPLDSKMVGILHFCHRDHKFQFECKHCTLSWKSCSSSVKNLPFWKNIQLLRMWVIRVDFLFITHICLWEAKCLRSFFHFKPGEISDDRAGWLVCLPLIWNWLSWAEEIQRCKNLAIEKCWRERMKRISDEPARRLDWCEKCWCQFLYHQTRIWNWAKFNFLYLSFKMSPFFQLGHVGRGQGSNYKVIGNIIVFIFPLGCLQIQRPPPTPLCRLPRLGLNLR